MPDDDIYYVELEDEQKSDSSESFHSSHSSSSSQPPESEKIDLNLGAGESHQGQLKGGSGNAK